jgi:hypothetical protein
MFNDRSLYMCGRVLLVVPGLLIPFSGCGPEDPAVGQEPAQTVEAALSFESPSAAYGWIAEEAGREQLSDVHVTRDTAGQVVRVTMGSDSRDRILAALRGDAGYFKVGNQQVTLPTAHAAQTAASGKDAQGDVGLRTSALTSGLPSSGTWCSGAFCLSGSSTNTHITLFGFGYHDVSGDTGGTITTQYIATTHTTPGCVNSICRTNCVCTTYTCNPGDALATVAATRETPQMEVCTHSMGSLSVGATFFSNTNDCGSGVCQNTPVAVFSGTASTQWSNGVGIEFTAFGTVEACQPNGFGPAECLLNGVCSSHDGSSQGGGVLGKRTAAGSYNCP